MNERNFDYDVALSFAGEDRNYVEQVANYLTEHNIKIFYDRYEMVHSWGMNLFEHLHDIYRNKARYCVIFISKDYERKVWPTHELRSAQERAIHESDVYILPARFDDTNLPGIQSTISYIDLRKITPEEFANIIIQKVTSTNTPQPDPQNPPFKIPRVQPSNFNQYEEALQFISYLREELDNRGKALSSLNASITTFEASGKTCFRIVHEGNTVFSLNVWMGGMVSDSGLSFYGTSGEIRSSQNSVNAWGEMAWNKEKDQINIKLHDISLLSFIPTSEKLLAKHEFVDLIWQRIVDEIENRTT